MRILIGLLALLSVAAAADKPSKSSHGKTLAPKAGIKTPGIQIPFTNLKAEAEFDAPAKPEWIFFSGSAFVPAKASIERIDPTSNKKAEPIAGLTKPCGGMVSAFDSLWAPACGASSLAR